MTREPEDLKRDRKLARELLGGHTSLGDALTAARMSEGEGHASSVSRMSRELGVARLTAEQWESDQWVPTKPGHASTVVEYLTERLDYLDPNDVYTYILRINGSIPSHLSVTYEKDA